MYLVVKNGNDTRSYECKTTHTGTPYMRVSSGYLDLTTETLSGLKVKVKNSTDTYRAKWLHDTPSTQTTGYSGVSSSESSYTQTTGYSGISSRKSTYTQTTGYSGVSSSNQSATQTTGYSGWTSSSNYTGYTKTTADTSTLTGAYTTKGTTRIYEWYQSRSSLSTTESGFQTINNIACRTAKGTTYNSGTVSGTATRSYGTLSINNSVATSTYSLYGRALGTWCGCVDNVIEATAYVNTSSIYFKQQGRSFMARASNSKKTQPSGVPAYAYLTSMKTSGSYYSVSYNYGSTYSGQTTSSVKGTMFSTTALTKQVITPVNYYTSSVNKGNMSSTTALTKETTRGSNYYTSSVNKGNMSNTTALTQQSTNEEDYYTTSISPGNMSSTTALTQATTVTIEE